MLEGMVVLLPGNLGLEWDELPDSSELECGEGNLEEGMA